jgi:hypothetical protein
MKFWTNHPLRVTGRLLWPGGGLLLAALNYSIHRAFCPKDSVPSACAAWLQKSARRVLRVFGVEAKCAGKIPSSGQLVCNHLSHLDILVLAALAPPVFVAKAMAISYALAGIHCVMTLITDFPLGLARLLPFSIHGWMERMIGPVLIVLPFGLSFDAQASV